MHSKVIIASLACILAGTIATGKGMTPSLAENKNDPLLEEKVDHAPNDFPRHVWISSDDGTAGDSFDVEINFETEYPGFQVLSKSPELGITYRSYGDYVSATITTSRSSGEFFVEFGYYSGFDHIVLSTIYVYSDGSYYCASSNSKNEAKSRFFHYHNATYEENDSISYRDQTYFNSGYYNAYDISKYSAEQRHANFVYGGSRDVSIDFLPFSGGNSSIIKLILHTNWIDSEGHSHPLTGVRADFFTSSSLLGQGDLHFTDNEGKYVVDLPVSQASGLKVNDVKCRISSVCLATSVEDAFYQNYPICYTAPYGTALSSYSELDIFIYVYSGRSDRGDAYEITQAQTVPYEYVGEYGDPLENVITQFPHEATAFYNAYYQTYFIRVQKEDAHSWDVLNHEYGHYICRQLNLCYTDNGNNYHNIHDNLGEGNEYLAFSEGLATYFGIAAQRYFAGTINISGYGDEIYQDPYRNFTVDYNIFAPGCSTSPFYGERVESSVTSVLLKMLDNVTRSYDTVALGDTKMWNILLQASYSGYESIVEFGNKAIEMYPSFATQLRNLLNNEHVTDYVYPGYGAKWTILMYICGSNLESGDKDSSGNWINTNPPGYASKDIEEILKVKNKPNNVKIVIETGGSDRWKNTQIDPNYQCRFEVGNNGNLILKQKVKKANMGYQSTFENFINWGLRNYPATNTGVILWNHGGAMDGCCGGLTNNETYNALENVFYNIRVDKKLEFIGYDACLMQMQDIAEFNSKYFKYMVGSEETEPADGWAYDKWLPELYDSKTTTKKITSKIVDTYISAYNKSGYAKDHTLSVLDLSKVATYKTKFESMANAIKTTVKNNYAAFENMVRTKVKGYADDKNCSAADYNDLVNNHYYNSSWFDKKGSKYYLHGYYLYGAVDSYDLVNKLQADSKYSSYSSYFTAVKDALNNLVIKNGKGSNAGESHGHLPGPVPVFRHLRAGHR